MPQNQVKVFHFHSVEAFVVKVDIDEFPDVVPFGKELFGTLIKQIRLSCLTDTYKHISSLLLKVERSLIEFYLLYFVLSLLDESLENFFLHGSIYLITVQIYDFYFLLPNKLRQICLLPINKSTTFCLLQ